MVSICHTFLIASLFAIQSLLAASAFAISCPVLKTYEPSPAEQAFLAHDYDKAAKLYNDQLQQKPDDPALIYGLNQILLREQKVAEAQELVQKAIAKNPDSAVLMTALGEVQYRAGTPWLTLVTMHKAMQKDPCFPQLHLLDAQMLRLNSFYASAASEVATAHRLDPYDPRIRLMWLYSLPTATRASELEAYLNSKTGDSPQELAQLRIQLDAMKKRLANPPRDCHLVSDTEATEISFVNIMRDINHQVGFGLDVKLNEKPARLQLDTGASGIVISRLVAERVGLKRLASNHVGGVGSEGERTGYTAYADDIRIGALEFHDCEIQVVDSRMAMENDGLIGADVFSGFLVTLDYPMRKLGLGRLPPRPDDPTPAKPTLNTDNSQDNASAGTDQPKPDMNTTGAAKPDTAKTPPANAHYGPHDRYIAPEMKDWDTVFRIGNDLLIPSVLNDKVTRLFILDTGAFQTIVTPDVARQVSRVSTDNDIIVRGISGQVEKVYSVDEITFKFSHITQTNRSVVAFDSPGVSSSLGMQVAGFIGINTLGQLTMKIDYRDGLVKFIYDPHRGAKYPGIN